MPGVRIVTDSACDLTEDLVKQHDVIVVPLTIRFGAEEFEDRSELTPDEFWHRCKGKGALPGTAAPPPGMFMAAFQRAANEGADGVLCLTISSKFSATYASAVTAADTFTAIPVRVFDTRSVTMGQGLIVIAAAEEAAAGAELDELVAASEDRTSADPRLRRPGRTRLPPAWRSHRRCPGPVGLTPLHQAGHHGQRRRSGRGVQAAHTDAGAQLPQRQGGRGCAAWSASPSPTGPATTSTRCSPSSGDPGTTPVLAVQLGPVVGSHTGPNTVGVCYIVPASATATDD